jgi:hypothetical protein
MDWLTPILTKIDNLAVLVLILSQLGLGWLFVTERKENRADRQALMDLLYKNTEALNSIRNAISAITGRPII